MKRVLQSAAQLYAQVIVDAIDDFMEKLGN
jgi:hypothetical protein